MGLFEAGGGGAGCGVDDIVGFVGSDAWWGFVQPGQFAHAEGDCVVGAGTVAADAERADHVAVDVEGDAAAEGDDAAWCGTQSWFRQRKVAGIEGVGVVQAVERAARLRGSVEICGGERQAVIAEIVRGACLGDGNGAAARPDIERWRELGRTDHRTQHAFAVDDRRPHAVRFENAAIAVGKVHDGAQFRLHGRDGAGRNAAWAVGSRGRCAKSQQKTCR